MGLIIIAVVLTVSVVLVLLKGFSQRTIGVVAVVLTVGAVLVLLNGYLTHRYAHCVVATEDLRASAYCLGPYAAEHGDVLPQSWEQLVAEGHVQPDPKAAARFRGYIENSIERPDRLRWIPGAKLSAYVVDGERVVDRATSQPARLIWLDGVTPADCGEFRMNVYLLDSWKEWKERQSSLPTTATAIP